MAVTEGMKAELASMRRRIGADAKVLDGFARDLFSADEARAKEMMEVSKQLKGLSRSLAQIGRLGYDD